MVNTAWRSNPYTSSLLSVIMYSSFIPMEGFLLESLKLEFRKSNLDI